MRLAEFIGAEVESILAEWEVFARGLVPGAQLNTLTLRDHAHDILLATVRDMQTAQGGPEQNDRKAGGEAAQELAGASQRHAVDRHGSGFNFLEVVSEYRALRASVLRLWRASLPEASVHDVDDLVRFNESIDKSLALAASTYSRRVNQARDLFLAILGHDLRNPLQSIAMTAQLIQRRGPHVAGTDASAAQISASVLVMDRMIGELLDYTRTRLGAGMPILPAPMDMGSLAKELISEFDAAHPDRDLRYSAEGNLEGEWDADRMRQAISNLLANAVQHGDPDLPIQLKVRGEESDIFISVNNSGTPIPPGELARIFEPLVRGMGADPSRKRRPNSIGLGLYIVRQVAASHGGEIDVDSTHDGGTSFTIHLPRHARPSLCPPDGPVAKTT